MKVYRFLRWTVVFALMLSLLFSSSAFGAPGRGDGGIFFNVQGLDFVREPAEETIIFVLAANVQKGGERAKLKRIQILDETGAKIAEKIPEKALENISDKVKDEEELKELVGLREVSEAEKHRPEWVEKAKQIQGMVEAQEFKFHLKAIKPSLKPGDTIGLKVVGDFSAKGKPVREEKTFSISYFGELPHIDSWYPGDGHIHTNYSDGGRLFTVGRRAWFAKKLLGFKWLIITDHAQMMDEQDWGDQVEDCEGAENAYNIAVMNGEELSTCVAYDPYAVSDKNPLTRPNHDSHYLAYNVETFIENPPKPQGTGNGQQTINLVNKHNYPNSFGVIAHPYWTPCLWNENWWNVTGFTGMELISGFERIARDRTLNRWDDVLEDGKHVVGLGNSDTHYFLHYGKLMTYLYMPGWDGIDHEKVYTAIREGQCVASTGPLVVFTVNDKPIGDTVSVMKKDTVTLDIAWKTTPEFGPIQRIDIVKNGDPVKRLGRPEGVEGYSGTKTVSYSVEEPGYFRLEGVTWSGRVAYTNPIWVKVTEPEISFVNSGEIKESSLVMDHQGDLHLFFANGQYLMYTSSSDHGATWSVPITLAGPYLPRHPAPSAPTYPNSSVNAVSATVDRNNKLHVCFYAMDRGTYDGTVVYQCDLLYATNQNGTWEVGTVIPAWGGGGYYGYVEGITPGSIYIASNDVIHIGGRHSGWWSWGGMLYDIHKLPNGTTWAREAMPYVRSGHVDAFLNAPPQIIEHEGTLKAFFFHHPEANPSASKIYYNKKIGGVWTGPYSDLPLNANYTAAGYSGEIEAGKIGMVADSQDHLHIAWANGTHNAVYYSPDGGNTVEVVDEEQTSIANVELTVSDDGSVLVSWRTVLADGGYAVRYRLKRSGTWGSILSLPWRHDNVLHTQISRNRKVIPGSVNLIGAAMGRYYIYRVH